MRITKVSKAELYDILVANPTGAEVLYRRRHEMADNMIVIDLIGQPSFSSDNESRYFQEVAIHYIYREKTFSQAIEINKFMKNIGIQFNYQPNRYDFIEDQFIDTYVTQLIMEDYRSDNNQ